jgi:hypothetical protein
VCRRMRRVGRSVAACAEDERHRTGASNPNAHHPVGEPSGYLLLEVSTIRICKAGQVAVRTEVVGGWCVAATAAGSPSSA